MKPIVFAEEARGDALEAYRYYEERQAGLGARFRDHLDAALSRIQRSPERYPVVYRSLRRTLVDRFPYLVFYQMAEGSLLVVAVMHARQNPKTWMSRAPG
jgi:plasmid stabilization system protein ParE